MSDKNIFLKYANILSIQGYKRSLLCDMQKNRLFFIPNIIFDILDRKRIIINDIKRLYNYELDDAIDKWIDFLIKNDLGFYTYNTKLFPNLDAKFYYPGVISNAIIDYSKIENFQNLKQNIFIQLDNLGCKAVQIVLRCFENNQLLEILKLADETGIESIEIIFIDNLIDFQEKYLKNILINNVKIKRVIIFSSDIKKETIVLKNDTIIQYSTNQYLSENCGSISPIHFVNNIVFFSESKCFNNCLNHKISIDVYGSIKNCPSMNTSFGNIREISINEAICKPGFTDLWGIHKDDIDVCKDCEFRYMCIDCRCFIKNPDDIYSQPAKCGYNPYVAKWSNEEGYITVDEWRKQNPNWEKKAKRKPLVKIPQKVE